MFAQFPIVRKIAWSALFLFWSFLITPCLATGQSIADDKPQSHIQDALKIHRQYKPVVGQPHPDFILPSIDGDKNIQLSDYRGKKVLLLHFASW